MRVRMKAKIIKCSNKDYWYKNCVGKVITVRLLKTEPQTPFVEDIKTGFNVLKSDLKFKGGKI